MLTARKEVILRVIVGDYVQSVMPVASESIARNKGLNVSPATVRMEMAEMEEEGYIVRPHISAGGLPSDKGYRHYVEHLVGRTDLTAAEKRKIQEKFRRVHFDVEEWIDTATSALPGITHAMALVSLPRAEKVRLRRLELVPIQGLLVLLILILQEAKVLRHLITLDQPMPSSELVTTSNKLTELFRGLTFKEIKEKDSELTPLERKVLACVKEILSLEEVKNYERPFFDGLQLLLDQPELADVTTLRDFMEILEAQDLLNQVIGQLQSSGETQVAIGSELKESKMRHFSVVFTEYGGTAQVRGVVGVLGPKRMDYCRNISAVSYLSDLLSRMTEEVYG